MAKIKGGNLRLKLTYERDGEVVERDLDFVNAEIESGTHQEIDGTVIDHFIIRGDVHRKYITSKEILSAIDDWWEVFVSETYNDDERREFHYQVMERLKKALS